MLARFLPYLAGLYALVGIKQSLTSLFPPNLYRKDLTSEWLTAKAVLAGRNPYEMLPTLADGLIPFMPTFLHPTPHTPFAVMISAPLGFVGFRAAAAIWLIGSIACLAVCARLIAERWEGKATRRSSAIIFGLMLGWLPVASDLFSGQFNILLLALLLFAWQSFDRKEDARAGIALGFMMAIKLAGWPIVIWLALQRRWRVVGAAIGITALLNLLAALALGWKAAIEYYRHVGPFVSNHYLRHDDNMSAWTIGPRLFAEFGYHFHTVPPISSSLLAQILAYMIPLALLIVALFASRNLNGGFPLMAGVGILLAPVAWLHSFVLAVPPLLYVAPKIQKAQWPHAVPVLLGLSFPWASLLKVAGWYVESPAAGAPSIPWVAGWLGMIPAFALIALVWMVWRTDRDPEGKRESREPTPGADVCTAIRSSPAFR